MNKNQIEKTEIRYKEGFFSSPTFCLSDVT